MKKLLSLMSLLAVSATSATSVVACTSEESSFNFAKSKDVLEHGTINVLDKADTDNLENDVNYIKEAIITRLIDGRHGESFDDLKSSDFQLSMGLKTISNNGVLELNFIMNDKVNEKNKDKFLAAVQDGKTSAYVFQIRPITGNVMNFENTLCIRDHISTTADALLNNYGDRPVHIFIQPSTIKTTEEFKEVFWNGVLGQPREYKKHKGDFDATISDQDLLKLQGLKYDNKATVALDVTFTIKNDFKTEQTGWSFKAGDKGTNDILFQTKL